jgi:hypothetical protein
VLVAGITGWLVSFLLRGQQPAAAPVVARSASG